MNLTTKKIIAKEFLMFLLCVGISIIVFLSIYPYNYYQKSQTEKYARKAVSKRIFADSLASTYNQKTYKQFWLTEKYTSQFKVSNTSDANDKVWDRLSLIAKSDSVKFNWEHTWGNELISFIKEIGFSDPKSFQSFILENLHDSTDIENSKASLKVYSESNNLQFRGEEFKKNILSLKNQLKTAALGFIIAFIVLFLVRYLVYCIQWSFNTLKQS